eukprot:8421677-Pyramimonas_sp.AAC.1
MFPEFGSCSGIIMGLRSRNPPTSVQHKYSGRSQLGLNQTTVIVLSPSQPPLLGSTRNRTSHLRRSSSFLEKGQEAAPQ